MDKKVIHEHTLRVGTNHQGGKVLVEIEIGEVDKGQELSICGSSWYRSGNDCYMAGQCLDSLPDEIKTWEVPRERYNRIVQVWNRWHLNNMNAGCEHQRKILRAHPKWDRDYSTLIKRDDFRPCPMCGYVYGSAWLHEPLPEEIIAEVKGWSDND